MTEQGWLAAERVCRLIDIERLKIRYQTGPGTGYGLAVTSVQGAQTVEDLARLLRNLRRREARRQGRPPLTYRELVDKTGWSLGTIGGYFTGQILPSTDRFDELVRLLGAVPAEQGALASARDRIEEATRGGKGTTRRRRVPQQLPASVALAGRDTALARLDAALAKSAAETVVCLVTGMAGVGKTAMTVYWAQRAAGEFPDGQLYVNLRGFEPDGSAMDAAEAVRGFLDALHVAPQHIPAGLDAQAGLLRSRLAGQRVLLVLDNARSADQVLPLLPGAPGCMVLVTSRHQLPGLVATVGAASVPLDLLTLNESRLLLANRLGEARTADEPQAVDEIVAACARLPLALAIVAARAANHPRFPLRALASELRDGGHRLDTLASGDPAVDVRTVFSWSYHDLKEPAARLFRQLSLHPGPDISVAAAASLAALPAARVRMTLTRLADANLIMEHVPGRYILHDLLRAYAAEQAHSVDPDDRRRAATNRILDHYLHTAHNAALLLEPTQNRLSPAPAQPGAVPEDLAGIEQATSWLKNEHRVLVAAVDHAANTGFHTHAWQLASTLRTFLDRQGHWHDLAATQGAAVRATARLSDPLAQSAAHRYLAHAYTRQAHFDQAHRHLTRALDLARQAGDLTGQAYTHHYLGHMWEQRGDHRQALEHNQQAQSLYEATGDRIGLARALNNVGWLHALLGEHPQALAACSEALALQQELNDRDGEASTLDSLGYLHRRLGDHAQSLTHYRRALDLYQGLDDRYNEATTLTYLGDTLHEAGETVAAQEIWRKALSILDRLDHPDADTVRARLVS